jgi:hypothetical protein
MEVLRGPGLRRIYANPQIHSVEFLAGVAMIVTFCAEIAFEARSKPPGVIPAHTPASGVLCQVCSSEALHP